MTEAWTPDLCGSSRRCRGRDRVTTRSTGRHHHWHRLPPYAYRLAAVFLLERQRTRRGGEETPPHDGWAWQPPPSLSRPLPLRRVPVLPTAARSPPSLRAPTGGATVGSLAGSAPFPPRRGLSPEGPSVFPP